MTENTQPWPALELGEEDITCSSDLCFRNVNPIFISEGIISSSAFMPTKGDEGELSTARSSKVTPRQHYDEFIQSGHSSDGVYSVTTDDIREEKLRWVDNESLQEESLYMTGHAYIDFRACTSKGTQKRKARSLARKAIQAYSSSSKE
ncbi:hypothetical protein [Bifidobacterium moukalabense]|uniref:hypothetical protein n=1 Tax=Bifidobacterium moukalabense TaxID=1333651 RepID=UPI0010F4F867|nr:hypothetical protein [Bifidobacterium moukalabense]